MRLTRRLLMLAVVLSVIGLTFAASLPGPDSVEAQGQKVCRWKSIGQWTRARYYQASGMDTDTNAMVVYGGLDESRESQKDVGIVDLSDPDIDNARHTSVTVNALRRFGAAGAYRSAGDLSAVYFFGGADSIADGEGTNDIQALTMKDKSWSQVTASGVFEDRFFAAAAWDAENDIIVVTGGVRQCGASDLPCSASSLPTKYVTVDDTGAVTVGNGPTGGPSGLFGHSMVYDSAAKQMIAYGGVRTTDRTQNTVYTLDMTDPATATWQSVTPTGGPPGLALHGASYDATNNWMIVYGGVTSDFFVPGRESANGKTYALDLSATAMTWADLDSTFGERIGGVMEYDPSHMASIFHGGRRRTASNGDASAFRDSHALICEDEDPNQTPGAPTNTTVPPTETTVPPTETTVPPTETTVPPTETTVPPTETTVPPTETTAPPTETTVGPTETTVPATETTVPPTETTVPPTETTVPPTETTAPPTETTVGPTATTAPPTPTIPSARVCDFILDVVPAQVINSAVTNPGTVQGYGQLCNPNLPPTRFNYPRSWLSIQHPGQAYHPLYNALAWKCGCP